MQTKTEVLERIERIKRTEEAAKRLGRSNEFFPGALEAAFVNTGLSMNIIAKRMRVSRQRVSDIRKSGRASISNMINLAHAFGYDEDYFVEVRLQKLEDKVKKNPYVVDILLACVDDQEFIKERTTGFEPATNSLEGCDSTN